MKKIIMLFVLVLTVTMITTSCADSKKFTDKKGKEFTAEPYGWANADARKIDTVVYQVNVGNVVWDILLSETIIVPVWLTGWQALEPVRLKDANGR